MSVCQNTRVMSVISHGATEFAEPVGGGFDEDIEWDINRPGTAVAPECVAIKSYGCTARARYQGHATPIARGTSNTLTFKLAQFLSTPASTTTTDVAIATMLAGSNHGDYDSSPHVMQTDFIYKGSSLAPITITVN